MTIIAWLMGKIRRQAVGTDALGNRYYQDNCLRDNGKCRRWVVYKGQAEASKVPPQWHAWLHYVVDTLPEKEKTYDWQKPHQRNLTGTKFAYKPTQWLYAGARDETVGYEAWKPE